ncbi:GT4 family glycosyltransferase PelF [Thermovibrio ammonificans]|uniref:Glycosyl transferase group 1 n=1 Tax=Thermovibrio ammonificans (strain DSM 15698 / JCM 12110 / HB-1) TaxID=648996 RepID=E8T6J0_THEA1|nr:GT4 family glycosyltransferase PelF [Thermovibrio ammonificans]ADU96774.1 glycosyl transferase group 1 [Thermovibrio ammonificans HB-1]
MFKPDVLIVAEGTYPYIRGGVSAWIDSLVRNLKEYSFGVFFIGSRREDYGEPAYTFPDNLTFYREIFLFEESELPPPAPRKFDEELLHRVRTLHDYLKTDYDEVPYPAVDPETFTTVIEEEEFLYGRSSWEYICEACIKYAGELPFVDYFWSVRNSHLPLWRVATSVGELPSANLVHSPSTGYAGFVASMLKNSRGIPFVLTEHGIYTRERKIDILSSETFTKHRYFFQREYGEIDYFKKMLINFFYSLGKIAYLSADVIISLFDKAREAQISLGAPPEKTRVIPNGIDVSQFEEVRAVKRRKNVVALIGRVVPIKDVKTFIKAARIVADKIDDFEAWIVGPTDEDPSYYEECRRLVSVLKLDGVVKFTGFRPVKEVLSQVKVATLTSISEGMPLVILESFAAGVPFVATDVGACPQLINGGLSEEDVALGRAGRVVPVADPAAAAEAYVELLTKPQLWSRCSETAFNRVSRFYSFDSFLESYRSIYEEFIRVSV